MPTVAIVIAVPDNYSGYPRSGRQGRNGGKRIVIIARVAARSRLHSGRVLWYYVPPDKKTLRTNFVI